MKQQSDHAAAAKMIRNHLKTLGIACKVRSDSYSGGSSIRIQIFDQSPEVCATVRQYADQFKYGDFDGMTDSYNYRQDRNNLPKVSYVFTDNEISPELKQAAWDNLRPYINGADSLPADYAALTWSHRFWDDAAQSQIYRFLTGSLLGDRSAAFWAARTTQQAAA